MMQGSLATRLRVLRARRGLSLTEAAAKARVQRQTLALLERGERKPHTPTLAKIASGYGVPVEELLTEPVLAGKAEPSAGDGGSKEVRGGDEQTALARVLRDFMVRRAEEHEREMRDPESPHFRTATAATLWLDGLYKELRDWWTWIYVNRAQLLPPFEEGANPTFWRPAFDAYLVPVIAFRTIHDQAEKRISTMADTPDELAMRRMEGSLAEAEEAQRRFEAVREAAG